MLSGRSIKGKSALNNSGARAWVAVEPDPAQQQGGGCRARPVHVAVPDDSPLSLLSEGCVQ